MKRDAIFSSNARIAILLIALLSLAGSVITALYGEKIVPPPSRDSDSFGKGPLGHKAFVEFFENMGFSVHRLRHDNHETIASPLWFLEPEWKAMFSDGEVRLDDILIERYHAGLPTVVALPKWKLERDPSGKRRASPVADYKVHRILQAVTLEKILYLKVNKDEYAHLTVREKQAEVRGLRNMHAFQVSLPNARTVSLPEDEGFVIAGTRDAALAFRYPDEESNLVVLSDPDLLHNFNLHKGEHAAFLYALAENISPSRNLILDEAFHGHSRTRSLGAAMGEYPPVLIVIQASLLGLLCVWAGLKRFGVPIPIPPRRGRGPGEVVSVAASLMSRGKRIDLMVGRYLTDILDDLGARLKITQKGVIKSDRAALAKRIDTLALRRNEEPFAEDLHQIAQRLAKGRRLGDRAALRYAEKAWKFRTSMLSTTKSSN